MSLCRPSVLRACPAVLGLTVLAALSIAGDELGFDTELPPTEIRFGWIRHEHQKPGEKSPRVKPWAETPFRNNFVSLRLAIEDLMRTFGDRYPNGPEYLARLERLEQAVKETDAPLTPLAEAFDRLFEEALLANPLIDFDRLLFVDSCNPMTPSNWLSLDSVGGTTRKDGVALKVLSPVSPRGEVTTLFVPPQNRNLIAIDLHWDAEKLLYTAEGVAHRGHQLFEVDLPPGVDPDTGQAIVREIETIAEDGVRNYDACYAPDDTIIFVSTATMNGVPCIGGQSPIGNLYRRKTDGTIERLTNDQDHDWHPTVMPDGRIMYLRWDYTDTPHAFNRILFAMNPDGTGQTAIYGSNSYWPNAIFYAKPVPGSPTRFVGTVTGHHSSTRGGLFVFDTARRRFETDGVVQQIPGYGQPVPPRIADGLGFRAPNTTTVHPLSDKYVLASCWPGGWRNEVNTQGIYLMDAFDNGLKLCAIDGRFLLEPTPWKKRPRPPVLPDQTDPVAKTGVVMLSDVYLGKGTEGVPRGTIRKLRLFSYNFAMRRMGGQGDRVGLDGPWDVRVILGTVPVEADGSASFTVPAMTPIAVQPLDAEGKAVQLMRSWFTCRPGEVLSCAGCHEDARTAPAPRTAAAALRTPSPIEPWCGTARGFSFNRDVQPVLDRYCIGCHHGATESAGSAGRRIPDLTLKPDIVVRGRDYYKRKNTPDEMTLTEQIDHPVGYPDKVPGTDGNSYGGAHFPPAYLELFRFARSATLESDLHLLTTFDYHVDQTHLVRMLKKGHHGVRLDAEAWSRVITWIDLNTPAHGSWKEIVNPEVPGEYGQKRAELMAKYGGVSFDPEVAVDLSKIDAVSPAMPVAPRDIVRPASIREEFPPAADAASLAEATGPEAGKLRTFSVDLAAQRASLDVAYARISDPGKRSRIDPATLKMTFVRIPAGAYVSGNAGGPEDEMHEGRVTVDKAFWMADRETTNALFSLFDPAHHSRLESAERLHFGDGIARGFPLNDPLQPVVRISQREALAFCRWLSEQIGRKCTLPTEPQWEWASLVGKCDEKGFAATDFGKRANLADRSYRDKHAHGEMPLWRPAALHADDGAKVSARVAAYAPNEAGLYDMIGNVAEWTRTSWVPPPGIDVLPHVVAKGGSWQDQPRDATPFSKRPVRPEIKFVDVGFRVVIED